MQIYLFIYLFIDKEGKRKNVVVEIESRKSLKSKLVASSIVKSRFRQINKEKNIKKIRGY